METSRETMCVDQESCVMVLNNLPKHGLEDLQKP